MVYYLQLKWRISIHFRSLQIMKFQVSFWGGTEVCPGGWKHIFDTIAILNRIAIIADFKIVILRNRISSQVRIFILMTSNDLSLVLISVTAKLNHCNMVRLIDPCLPRFFRNDSQGRVSVDMNHIVCWIDFSEQIKEMFSVRFEYRMM